MFDVLLYAGLGVLLVPLTVYFSVKLGTYAYLLARRKFARDYHDSPQGREKA